MNHGYRKKEKRCKLKAYITYSIKQKIPPILRKKGLSSYRMLSELKQKVEIKTLNTQNKEY
jgi:hypothetical protein